MKGDLTMVKLVAMFRLPPGVDPDAFDRYFADKHAAQDAARMPGLRRYTIGKVVDAPGGGTPAWRWVNELWFDSLETAQLALNSPVGVAASDDLMPRVSDFTAVFVIDQDVQLP
jgi:uncharacterized protein (TIGR02118 family)